MPQNVEDLAILTVLASGIPGIEWEHGDDLCDCTFQRIGFWTNPYIGRTMHIRLCCVWKELAKEHPQFFRETPAFYDYNQGVYREGTLDWNSIEHDMPRAIWYRQLVARTGKSLDEIREEYSDQEPPARVDALTNEQTAALAGARTLSFEHEATD